MPTSSRHAATGASRLESQTRTRRWSMRRSTSRVRRPRTCRRAGTSSKAACTIRDSKRPYYRRSLSACNTQHRGVRYRPRRSRLTRRPRPLQTRHSHQRDTGSCSYSRQRGRSTGSCQGTTSPSASCARTTETRASWRSTKRQPDCTRSVRSGSQQR